MHRKPLIIANWKSHKIASDATAWMSQLGKVTNGLEFVVAPPTLYFGTVSELPNGVVLGAQDVSPFPMGAYTGAIAAAQLADCGVKYCLVGHSERRRYFHETNQEVVNKCEQLLAVGIRPVICVDLPYAKEQLQLISSANIRSESIDIAYEPLAAIGTGQAADPTSESTVIAELQREWPDSRVLYGGSVTAENVGSYLLIAQGVLVATASLDVHSMNAILVNAEASAIPKT